MIQEAKRNIKFIKIRCKNKLKYLTSYPLVGVSYAGIQYNKHNIKVSHVLTLKYDFFI